MKAEHECWVVYSHKCHPKDWIPIQDLGESSYFAPLCVCLCGWMSRKSETEKLETLELVDQPKPETLKWEKVSPISHSHAARVNRDSRQWLF
jgi:hypothetical protein